MSKERKPTRTHRTAAAIAVALASTLVVLVSQRASHAHCNAMDGPIVPVAQQALEDGQLTPVLKWVREQDEEAIQEAFARARAVRGRGDEVREIADLWFLETLIRIHREGEGEPYTGLQPAGSADPVFAAADAALETGSVDELAAEIAAAVRAGIETRFAETLEKRRRAEESVELGREYVEAYVSYMHFVEGIDRFLESGARAAHSEGGRPHEAGATGYGGG